MKNKFFNVIKMTSYSPIEGYKEWFEIIPWIDDKEIYINLTEMEKQENDK